MIFCLMCAHSHHILHFIPCSISFSNKNNYANDTRTSTASKHRGWKTLRRKHARFFSLWKRREKNEESIYISFQDLNLMEAQSDKKFLCIRIQRRSYAKQSDLNAPVYHSANAILLFALIFIFLTFAVVISSAHLYFFCRLFLITTLFSTKGKIPIFFAVPYLTRTYGPLLIMSRRTISFILGVIQVFVVMTFSSFFPCECQLDSHRRELLKY